MIGLDTNVLVRYIMQDDTKQSPQAIALIESLIAEQVRQALEALLRTRELVVDRADQVLLALRTWRDGKADFADCLIASAAASAGCERVMTFDVGAAKHAGMTLLR